MVVASIPSAACASFQPLAADHHHTGHAHREPATRPSFGSLAHAPVDGRHGDAGPRGFDSGRAKLVRRLIRKRRQREQHFPSDLFADPAWDMMLDLYAAHYERREISVSSLCIPAAVPATTALRVITPMVEAGRFVRAEARGGGAE